MDISDRSANPIRRRISLIIHAPTIPSERSRKVHEVLGWNDPDDLVDDFIEDMSDASHGIARFDMVERIEVDEFPLKADGFRYDAKEFIRAWRRRSGFHEPDLVDYSRLLDQFEMVHKVAVREIDEAWLMAFPYAGYYESIMGGPGAFWCNAPPLSGTERSQRRFVVMGFNYERGVGEMMESFGHRAESILAKVYERKRGEHNLWERFTRHEKTHPGRAEVGNMHFAPNSERDYDWGNRHQISSSCNDWYNFPQLTGTRKTVDCAAWGGGDIRSHHMWWYQHLPHVHGETEGVLNNWWAYVLEPDLVA